jgi:ATP-dependent Clp protease adapter protein ClpS
MNNETKQKMYTVITLNETRTILMFVQLTLGQLQEVLPKYVIRMLTGDQRHLLQIDGKYGKYSFCDMTIGSSKSLVVEIDFKRFSKLCPSDTFQVFTKTCETITKTECVGLNPTDTDTFNSVKRGKPRLWKVVHYSESDKRKNEPNYVVPMTQDDYSLTYLPGNRFYNSERYSRLCA